MSYNMYHSGNIVDNMCFFCRSVLRTFRLRVLKFFGQFSVLQIRQPRELCSQLGNLCKLGLHGNHGAAGIPQLYNRKLCIIVSLLLLYETMENNDDCIIV